MSTKLHQFIQAHIEAQFPGCDVKCATNPNEEWLAIIDGIAYVATMHGDSEGLTFTLIHNGFAEDEDEIAMTFDVTLTDDEMIEAVRHRDDDAPRSSKQEMAARVDAVMDLQRQQDERVKAAGTPLNDDATQASPAWQLVEVLDPDLAEEMIEHFKLSQEIATLEPFDIITMIANFKVGQR